MASKEKVGVLLLVSAHLLIVLALLASALGTPMAWPIFGISVVVLFSGMKMLKEASKS